MQFTAPLPFGTSRVPNPFLLFLPVFVEESPAKRILPNFTKAQPLFRCLARLGRGKVIPVSVLTFELRHLSQQAVTDRLHQVGLAETDATVLRGGPARGRDPRGLAPTRRSA